MTQTGGKRGTNSALKSWVAFVKKVQKEEKLSYPEAMKRASKRKSEWKRSMKGGEPYDDSMTPDNDDNTSSSTTFDSETVEDASGEPIAEIDSETTTTTTDDEDLQGGRRRRRRRRSTRRHRGGRSRSRGRTARRSRSRGRGRGKY